MRQVAFLGGLVGSETNVCEESRRKTVSENNRFDKQSPKSRYNGNQQKDDLLKTIRENPAAMLP